MRLLALALALALLAGCTTPPPPPVTTPTGTTPSTPTPGDGGDVNGFNESRALDLARGQVLRPDGSVRHRVPGTPGNGEAARLIADELAAQGLAVRWRHFNATYGCERVAMHNVEGTLAGGPGPVVYLAAHYDTRPVADKDDERTDEPIPGAIDGAGGVGVLLELARALADGPRLNATVVFLFFDGEDGGGYKGDACTDWILGSTSYAANLTDADVERAYGLVLLDLIGAADARFPKEGNSLRAPNGALTNEIWSVADDLRYARFVDAAGPFITDDHVPFIARGVRATDIIDIRIGARTFGDYHHTHDDDVHALDAGVLGEVGRVVEAWLLGRFA